MDFSIDLVDPGYRELLDDPDSPQYVDLAHHLQEQVRASREPAGLALTWAQNFLFPQSVLLVKELRAHGHTGRAGPGRARARLAAVLPFCHVFPPRTEAKSLNAASGSCGVSPESQRDTTADVAKRRYVTSVSRCLSGPKIDLSQGSSFTGPARRRRRAASGSAQPPDGGREAVV